MIARRRRHAAMIFAMGFVIDICISPRLSPAQRRQVSLISLTASYEFIFIARSRCRRHLAGVKATRRIRRRRAAQPAPMGFGRRQAGQRAPAQQRTAKMRR